MNLLFPYTTLFRSAVLLLLGRVGDHGLGRDQQARDRRGILQRRAHDLGRVDDAGLEHVHVLAVLRIEADGGVLGVVDLADDDGALRSEEHTSELQSLMRISYAVFCLKKKKY